MGSCPECLEKYEKTRYKYSDGILYKVYIHGDGSECLEPKLDIDMTRMKIDRVVIDNREKQKGLDRILEDLGNVFGAFCNTVEYQQLTEGDIWFPSVDLVAELKTMRDLDDSMKDDRLDDEIFRASEKHKHVVVCCIGSYLMYASETDEYSTVDFLTKLRRLLGFSATVTASHRIENFQPFDDEFCLCYWLVSYAYALEKVEKDDKIYFIKRMKIPKNEEKTVSILRVADGIDIVKAKRIYDSPKVESIADIVRNPDVLDGIHGVKDKLKSNIVNMLENRKKRGET